MESYHKAILSFLIAAQNEGFVHKDLDVTLLSGIFIDRVIGQILYNPDAGKDKEYTERWLETSIQLFLFGFAPKKS